MKKSSNKICFLTCFLLLCNFIIKAQDCTTLNNFNEFHGVKFGKPIPFSLRKYCDKFDETHNYVFKSQYGDSTFTIPDKVMENIKLKNMAKFGGQFSSPYFVSLKDGRLFQCGLFKFFDSSDRISNENKEYPYFFQKVTAEIRSIFGEYSKETIENDMLVAIVRSWECDNIKIEFSMNLSISSYNLEFTDKYLEKQRKFLHYSK